MTASPRLVGVLMLALWCVGLPGADLAYAQETVTGEVRDSESRPVIVRVHAFQSKPRPKAWSVKGKDDGSFMVDGLSPFPVELRVEADGFTTERLEIQLGDTSVPRHANVVLMRTAFVEGRVVDVLGLPVVGARVSVEEAGVSPSRGRGSSAIGTVPMGRFVKTQRDGSFRLVVPAGRSFRLEIVQEGCSTAISNPILANQDAAIAAQAITMNCRLQ